MSMRLRAPVDVSRIVVTGAVISMFTLAYLWRIFQMQVIEGTIYAQRAQQTVQRVEPVFPQRGLIYDRHQDEPVATNRGSFALTVVPGDIPSDQLDGVLRELAALVDRDEVTMRNRIAGTRRGRFQPVEVATGLSVEQIASVAERLDRLPGISWYSKPERFYPHGDLMANILGYVGDITSQELQVLFNEGYTANSILGKSGIEQRYDMQLRGSDGQRFRSVDARGRYIDQDARLIEPRGGNELVLTIDRHLQALATEALGARIGSVVVMQPHTGEVLAMVTYPRFDPNQFTGPDGPQNIRRLSLDQRAPFLNRPIQSAASPASTFKVVMNAAILGEQAFSPEETIMCTGSFRFGNRVFNDWLEFGHGRMNLGSALAQSCNIYYYTMGANHLSVDQIIDYSFRLGLGTRTGIDLGGEVEGLVPSPAWKEQTLNQRWVGGDTVNMSIGQGYLQVTPLQMAVMTSTIVNGGTVYRPFVMQEIRDPDTGVIIEQNQPTAIRESGIAQDTLRTVREHLRQVLTEGTAEVVITTAAVESAGKTGTGQIGLEGQYHSWFVAYAPYGEDVDPDEQIVVVVMVDAANEWEWWAPKAANIIMHGHFRQLPYEETIADLRRGPRWLWYM